MKSALLFILIFCLSCTPKKQPDNKLTGMWKLEIMELFDTETQKYKPWKDGMGGYLLYEASGHMALHLTTKAYPETTLAFKNFTDTLALEKLQYLTQNYNYMGSYTIDEQNHIVTHTKLSHSNPNEWGELSVRAYDFVGDTLVIKPVEEKNAGLRLKLIKQKSIAN